ERMLEHSDQIRLATREMYVMPSNPRASAQSRKLCRHAIASEPELFAAQLGGRAAGGAYSVSILIEPDETMPSKIRRRLGYSEGRHVSSVREETDFDGTHTPSHQRALLRTRHPDGDVDVPPQHILVAIGDDELPLNFRIATADLRQH